MVTAASLPGCAENADSHAARLCRRAIPALDQPDDVIELRSIEERSNLAAKSTQITVNYSRIAPNGLRDRQTLTCLFASTGAPARPADLQSIEVNGAPIGPLRTHILRSRWLGTPEAILNEPRPLIAYGPMPVVSRNAALAVQIGLAALPTIALYTLLATAFALVYGLMGRINLAIGDFVHLMGWAAFLGFILSGTTLTGYAIAMATVLCSIASLIYASALARLIFEPLTRDTTRRHGQPFIIATIGLSIAFAELLRLIQGHGPRWLPPPPQEHPLAIARSGDFFITTSLSGLMVTGIALSASVATVLLMQATRFGRHWRATSDDPETVALFGIDPMRLQSQTVALSALLAGLVGLLMTLHYGGVGSAGGLSIGLKALIAAIIGGIGSLPGAMIGAIMIGISEALWASAFLVETWDIALFSVLVVVLTLRPGGLLGRHA